MKVFAKEMTDRAYGYIGVNEENGTHKIIIDSYNMIDPLPRDYKVKYNDNWCAAFVSAVARELNATDIFPVECSCGYMVMKANKMGIYFGVNKHMLPQEGDLIFYHWHDKGKGDCGGYPEHVGIVMDVYPDHFVTIEGNYQNAVKCRSLPYNNKHIVGIARPDYIKNGSDATGLSKEVTPFIVQSVIRGQFGDGEERRARLKGLGLNPDTVQEMVNISLGYHKDENGKWIHY